MRRFLGLERELWMDKKPIDRRGDPRYVRIVLMQADSYLIGKTIDLSRIGARVQLHQPLVVGELLKMDLAAGDQILEIPARAVRVVQVSDNEYQVGLAFEPLEEETRRALERFLESTGF